MRSTTLGFKLIYPVRYLYFKLFFFFSPEKEYLYGQSDNAKTNLSQIWLEASIWVEPVSSSRNNACRKPFWIPDTQDLFLPIHRWCHCLQQMKDFFRPKFVGTSYTRDCQPVVLVLHPKSSVQSLLFRKEEVQSVMLVSWSLGLWAHPLGTCSSGRCYVCLEERISHILWALNGLVEILIKCSFVFLHAIEMSLALLQYVLYPFFPQSTMTFVSCEKT